MYGNNLMVSEISISIYAGAVAKNAGLDSDTAVYVSCTVIEEDCDGENLKHAFNVLQHVIFMRNSLCL